jgi:hypothetical protein
MNPPAPHPVFSNKHIGPAYRVGLCRDLSGAPDFPYDERNGPTTFLEDQRLLIPEILQDPGTGISMPALSSTSRTFDEQLYID